MGRRADHNRQQLYAMALDAAGEIAAADGPRALTARRIAARIGYSAATLYNLFDDLDDLIVHLNGRTLDALHDALSPAALGADPAAALRRMVKDYVGFAAAHANLWNLAFEHRLPADRPLPAWHHGKVARLCALFERPLAPLLGPGRERESARSARILWASLRGICALDMAQGLDAGESVELMADTLVTHYLGGLGAEQPRPAAAKRAPVRRQAVAKSAPRQPAPPAPKPAAARPAKVAKVTMPAPVRRSAPRPATKVARPAPEPPAAPRKMPPEAPPEPPHGPPPGPANVDEADQLAADIEGIWDTYESEIGEDETLKAWRKRHLR
jgi:AcrR family transcriptional regulator